MMKTEEQMKREIDNLRDELDDLKMTLEYVVRLLEHDEAEHTGFNWTRFRGIGG